MPLYEYECAECHKRTEKIQKFSDPELTICPHCGGPLARTITAAAISFKGSGWYKDLYSSAKPAAPAGDAAASGSASGDGSSAPAAPAGNAAPGAPAASSAPAPAAPAPAASAPAKP